MFSEQFTHRTSRATSLSRRLSASVWIAGAALWLLGSGAASAQFAQYTPPGSAGLEPQDVRRELETAMSEARWSLGSLRVEPWFAVKDVAYVDNARPDVPNADADFTATAGVGLRGYVPVSPALTLALHALPEFVWWQDQEDRRQVNGRYGVGLFGFFAEGRFEITATRQEAQRFVSSEIETLVSARRDRIGGSLDLPIRSGLGFFGSAWLLEHENLEGEPEDADLPAFDALDREEQVLRAGLRFRKGAWEWGAGIEESQVEFDRNAINRSNSGSSPFLFLRYERETLTVSADLVQRDLSGDPPSSSNDPAGFLNYEELTGEARLNYFTGNRFRLGLYTSQQLGYSLSVDYSYFETSRSGLSAALDLGWRSRLSIFGEAGTNDYVAFSPLTPSRNDDLAAFGTRLAFQLSDRMLGSIGVTVTDYDSNLDLFDRELTLVRAGITLGSGRSSWW